jgi:inward rectifier potassium channel
MKKSRYYTRNYGRLIRRDGQVNRVERVGGSTWRFKDLYHWLITLSWMQFFSLIFALYFFTNTGFAIAYLFGGDCLVNAKHGSFQDAFFFSVQTLATIGYGAIYPGTMYANILVTLEAFVGLLGVAIVTGLAFARFSQPTAKVLFSNIAVIAPYNGVLTLMYRTANQRNNQIIEAQQIATIVRNEVSQEGESLRRFYDLKLVRSQTPIFALTWTVMHVIDENSPLYGMTFEDFFQQEAEIIISLTGLDETVSQTIHARHSFIADEILWNYKFVDILSTTPDGRRRIDYTRFHDVIPLLN